MTDTTRSVQFGETTIPFVVHRSGARETVAITVEPSSIVRIVTPASCPGEVVDKAVRKKAPWILKQWDEQSQRAKPCRRDFVVGETFFYLGRGYKLHIECGNPSRAKLAGALLRVHVENKYSDAAVVKSHVQGLLAEWYRSRGTTYLTNVANEFASKIGEVKPQVTVTTIETRWGSCTGQSISFDWRIMMAPRRLVRYVAAHEVCHMRHPDHSRSFWRLLERVVPDCMARHAELSTIGPRLSF